MQDLIRNRMKELDDSLQRGDVTPDSARNLVARQIGFADWRDLTVSMKATEDGSAAAPAGMSSRPPFYRIDPTTNTIEPRQPLSAKDWDIIIGVMKEQHITGLNAGGQMTDHTMKRLSELDQVVRLGLGGSKRLTDEGLGYLAKLPTIEELDLSGWHNKITDKGLRVLEALKHLRKLQMCWCRVSDEGMAAVKHLDHLERVDLLGSTTGDGAIAALTNKPMLREFKTGRLVTDAGLPLLHDFPVFRSWQGGETHYALMEADCKPNHLLLDGPFTDTGFASVSGLEGIFGLSFFWHLGPGFTPEGLKGLVDLPNLGYLGCQDKLCDDTAMRHIASASRLRMLMGQGAVASDDGFTALSRSTSIEYFWGRKCPNLTGRGFAALANLPTLRGLAVSCKEVDDDALSTLSRFPALEEFMPMDVPDEGFRHIGECKQLRALWCMYCRDTGDEATSHITGLTNLETYYAGKTRITDRSLEMLATIPSLQRLTFWECAGITDAGIKALTRLPRLREVNLDGSRRVTRKGAGVFGDNVKVNYG
jgi:hypothetical protein